MNPIAPHNPPIPSIPGQLPNGGGGGKQQDGSSFDDVLSGVPTKGLPSPIEDHSPPPNIDDTDPDDQSGVLLPRPMRWKGSRGTVADTGGSDAGTGVPLAPTQPDLRSMVPAVALSADWRPPTAPPDGGEGTTSDTGSTTQDAVSGISASDARGGNSSTGGYAIMSSRLAPVSDWVPNGIIADNTPPAGTSLPVASPAAVVAGPTDQLPPPGASANPGAASETSADTSPNVSVPSGQTAVMSSSLTPMPPPGAATVIMGLTDFIAAPGTAAPGWASETAIPPDIRPGTTKVTRTTETQTPTIADAKNALAEGEPTIGLGQTTIFPPEAPSVTTGASNQKGVRSNVDAANGREQGRSSLPNLKDARINVDPISTSGATSMSADPLPTATTDSVPKVDAAGLWSGSNPGTKGAADVATTPAPTAAPNPQAEVSAASKTDEAKIAASTAFDPPRVRDSKMLGAQVTVGKSIIQNYSDGGTPVAKEAEVVNATLSTNEKAAQVGPLPKRGGGTSAGVAPSSRQAAGSTPGRQIFTDVPVSGATETAAQVVATPTPEPTAARQVVKVETLLQNALTAGESVRPNGQDHMEMRVSLGGGSEDVTVRMQVVNERMQVTFQTNSPEMRKALEQGWGQFSTTAAHTSTLALSAPRFETASAGAVAQGQGTDAQGFSFDQQNSRRQEAPTPAFDDGGPTAGNRRPELPTAATTLPATAGQATARRWSGWA